MSDELNPQNLPPCPKCGDSKALYGKETIGCGRCSWEATLEDWQSRFLPSEGDKKLLEVLSNALNNVALRVIGNWGGCWCKRNPQGSANIVDHESDCVAAREAIAEYDSLIERLGK